MKPLILKGVMIEVPLKTEQIACECGHKSHFDDIEREVGCSQAEDIQPIVTIYGSMMVCKACREGHPLPKDFEASLCPHGINTEEYPCSECEADA